MTSADNKKTFSQNLNYFMTQKGISRYDLCDALHLKYSTVTEWLNANKYPRIDKIGMLADYFGISKTDLIEPRNNSPDETSVPAYDNIVPINSENTVKIRILGKIACGQPIFDDTVNTDISAADVKADFALICKGDSMKGARINDGDIVYIRAMPIVENGQIAAVAIDNEATLKRFYFYPEQGKLLLVSENSAYEPMIYSGDELNSVRVLGLAVAFTSVIK